jgi:hypothetical protein
MLDGEALVPAAASNSRSSMSTAPAPALTLSANAGALPVTVAFVPDAYAQVPPAQVSPPKIPTADVTLTWSVYDPLQTYTRALAPRLESPFEIVA